MARYQRYRRYRRFRAKRWSSRIQNMDITQSVASGQNFFVFRNLATNPVQDADTVSNRYTVKNIRVQFTLEQNSTAEANSLENCQAFILFIPQGFTASSATAYDHPEWIMASKHIGIPLSVNNPGYNPLTMSTRLSRKLDTGDKIIFCVQGTNTTTTNVTGRITGIIRYNTKAN